MPSDKSLILSLPHFPFCKLQDNTPSFPAFSWVDTVWDLDFTEAEPLDSRVEEGITEDGLDAFTRLYDTLSPFAAEDHGTTESVWTLFAENNLSHNALVAILYHFVQMGLHKRANVQQRVYALHAAGLYFLLLEIPGSVANQVFHQVMFDKCLETLQKTWPQESDLTRKRKKNHGKSPQANTKNKKRGRPNRRESSEMDEIFEEEEEEENQEEVYFSAQDLLQIRQAVFLLMKNFLRLLLKFSLKEKPQCIFVELTSFEPTSQHVLLLRNINQAKYVPELAYHGLRLLCSPLHGVEDKILRRIFHRILNVILMIAGEKGSRTTVLPATSQVVSIRNQTMKFISAVVDELKEVAFPVLRILLQHICAKVPDKSEYRTYAAQALVQLLNKLPCAAYADFMSWLYRYSHNIKISYRVFALDIALALLDLPEREPDSSLSPEHEKFLKHKFLVQIMVFGRCSDKAPTVRSKALCSFAHCLEMKATTTLESIQELLQGKEIITMLRLRAGDEKTNVRKSALQVFMSILKHQVIPCTPEDLSTIQDRCRDPAISVRKQALQSITELLMSQPSNILIQKAWLTGVVPVVMDTESSVQEKALVCLDQLLLQNIKHYRRFSHEDRNQTLAWDLLTLFTSESQEFSRYLNKAFQIWSKQDKFSSTFINNVMSHVETEHAVPAWMLLAKVAGSSPKLDYSKIIESWDSVNREQNVSANTIGHILCVIGHVAKHLPRSTQERLTDDIKVWLKEFRCPLEVISPAVEALQKLCHAYSNSPEETQELLNEVCGDVISACECYLSRILLKEDRTEQLQEDLLVSHLFTLGEAAQLCPAKVEKRIFLLIQSILASPVHAEQSKTLSVSQPLFQFRGSPMPSVVRAHAFITLGKLCLQHEDLAKKCIAALARELEVSDDVAIRNNVIIVMCDLCVRYTTMVDRYIPNISMCLKDPNPFIRRQTLILLTNLLQEEFVKWKESLFFRFVSVLVDPSPDIASFGEFCLVHLLLKRNPVMFSQHFIECIFHFNSYEKHEKYNRFPQSDRSKNLFSLRGKHNKGKRMHIYKFLLEHFTDEQRFSITSKINLNILACFVDEVLPLDMEANELLSDTFEILSCKEIKLSAMRSIPDEDNQPEEDEMAMANAVMQAAQKKLISQVQKKNFIENLIPVITSLKSLLENKRMPAVRDLMNYLRETMQDYRNEIKEFFAVDKQLAAELEYDMKKYEEQLARENEMGEDQNSSLQGKDCTVMNSVQVLVSTSPQRAPVVYKACCRFGGGCLTDTHVPLSHFTFIPSGVTCRIKLFWCSCGLLSLRQMSLSTLAILNSAKKAAEATMKQRSKSVGGRCSLASPTSAAGSKHGKQLAVDLWVVQNSFNGSNLTVRPMSWKCECRAALPSPILTVTLIIFSRVFPQPKPTVCWSECSPGRPSNQYPRA
uniref:Condensin-2 complex subunit D3 n=1 Tax=Crocodylus porosus TaxID=8502 RepID=A0A7M4FS80_CROPO